MPGFCQLTFTTFCSSRRISLMVVFVFTGMNGVEMNGLKGFTL